MEKTVMTNTILSKFKTMLIIAGLVYTSACAAGGERHQVDAFTNEMDATVAEMIETIKSGEDSDGIAKAGEIFAAKKDELTKAFVSAKELANKENSDEMRKILRENIDRNRRILALAVMKNRAKLVGEKAAAATIQNVLDDLPSIFKI